MYDDVLQELGYQVEDSVPRLEVEECRKPAPNSDERNIGPAVWWGSSSCPLMASTL